jgi:hypothetical protein
MYPDLSCGSFRSLARVVAVDYGASTEWPLRGERIEKRV